MSKSEHRGWHREWKWDVPQCQAAHASGLFVTLETNGDAWQVVIDPDHDRHMLRILASDTDATTAVRTLARLKREAVDGFAYAAKKHAYDAEKAQRAAIESGHV